MKKKSNFPEKIIMMTSKERMSVGLTDTQQKWTTAEVFVSLLPKKYLQHQGHGHLLKIMHSPGMHEMSHSPQTVVSTRSNIVQAFHSQQIELQKTTNVVL